MARRPCRSPDEAERLRRALAVDSPGYVTLTVEGRDLVLGTTASSASRARATLEDLLACLQAAEHTPGPG
ncbi:MAG TPA: KEOPS complex subunit Pcc1 [Thermoplasmata archaeon]|nr:KEOPS complex subunit Pcc1 [Thermoplasmata archaeon]